MKGFYEILRDMEKELNNERKNAEDKKFREDMKKMANQLKIMKEELIKAGFESEFVDAMILELIKTQRGI